MKTNTRANHYHNYHEEKKESHGDIKLSEDDRILLRMKGEKQGRPWADILAVTSFKDKHEAHVRYNEIKHLADNEKKNNANQDKKKDVDKDKVERAAKKREEGLRKQAEAREKKEAAEKAEKATDERWERFLKEQEKEKEKEVEHDAAKPKKRTSFAISRPQNSLNKRVGLTTPSLQEWRETQRADKEPGDSISSTDLWPRTQVNQGIGRKLRPKEVAGAGFQTLRPDW